MQNSYLDLLADLHSSKIILSNMRYYLIGLALCFKVIPVNRFLCQCEHHGSDHTSSWLLSFGIGGSMAITQSSIAPLN